MGQLWGIQEKNSFSSKPLHDSYLKLEVSTQIQPPSDVFSFIIYDIIMLFSSIILVTCFVNMSVSTNTEIYKSSVLLFIYSEIRIVCTLRFSVILNEDMDTQCLLLAGLKVQGTEEIFYKDQNEPEDDSKVNSRVN